MKRFYFLILMLVPALVFSDDSTISLKPPAGDLSVVFLGDIFGVVDGILHGTGSQMLGSIFAVFNSAVLALGGIIVMYTLLVSTMNTAQEGQFMGQKWSSLWVPIRTTFGLALLIPKASGYCLMQVFVMWIVVQGVGAADKVWDAALGYLNRGGVIVQGQQNPGVELVTPSGGDIAQGALAILQGQVCMGGLQKVLKSEKQQLLKQKQNNYGPCYGSVDSTMEKFCNNSVPNFISSVNMIQAQEQDPPPPGASSSLNYVVDMPNFESSSPYASLNGICGTIAWKSIVLYGQHNVSKITTLANDKSGLDIAQRSRSIAIQQMYSDLAIVAGAMVDNMPDSTNTDRQLAGETEQPVSPVAQQPFGEPLSASNSSDCKAQDTCVNWGLPGGENAGVLFSGTEFQGALMDYNAVMLPTLNLINQAKNLDRTNSSHQFIQNAIKDGWLMAGSYFFYLVNLNTTAHAPNITDQDTGIDSSSFSVSNMKSAFGRSNTCNQGNQHADLCHWLSGNKNQILDIQYLIQGGGDVTSAAISDPDFKNGRSSLQEGDAANTVNGYASNAMSIKLPGQPGKQGLSFTDMVNPRQSWSSYTFPEMSFGCGEVKILFFVFCIAEYFGELLYDALFVPIYNALLQYVEPIIDNFLTAIFLTPLKGMALIFGQGVQQISHVGANNPIVLLAKMGVNYINFSWSLYLTTFLFALTIMLIPVLGVIILVGFLIAMPIFSAWLTIMVSIGFSTAYYVPLVPYSIFTFCSIGWFMAVIEAMVAAPIVALGVTHPEGHEAFGKGEAALMILMNVFLRPSMMIIGYITAIMLSYVGVWVLNAGFDNAIGFVQGGSFFQTGNDQLGGSLSSHSNISGGYAGMAALYAYFFAVLMYISMYLAIVTKSFTLISSLPDKVLRWIGGQPESIGQETSQWGEEGKQKMESAAKATDEQQAETAKRVEHAPKDVAKGVKKQFGKGKGGGGGGGEGSMTPKGGGGGGGKGGGA